MLEQTSLYMKQIYKVEVIPTLDQQVFRKQGDIIGFLILEPPQKNDLAGEYLQAKLYSNRI